MKKNTVTKEMIDKIVANSETETYTVFDKCTVVAMKLPNGFVLVESSACVDPDNYDVKLGESICKEKLVNKVWELEGYCLQNKLANCKNPRKLEDITIGELVFMGYRCVLEDFPLEGISKIMIGGRG